MHWSIIADVTNMQVTHHAADHLDGNLRDPVPQRLEHLQPRLLLLDCSAKFCWRSNDQDEHAADTEDDMSQTN